MFKLKLTNDEQYICYSIYSSLLTLVNTNITVHCLFMLVHSALTNVKTYKYWF